VSEASSFSWHARVQAIACSFLLCSASIQKYTVLLRVHTGGEFFGVLRCSFHDGSWTWWTLGAIGGAGSRHNTHSLVSGGRGRSGIGKGIGRRGMEVRLGI